MENHLGTNYHTTWEQTTTDMLLVHDANKQLCHGSDTSDVNPADKKLHYWQHAREKVAYIYMQLHKDREKETRHTWTFLHSIPSLPTKGSSWVVIGGEGVPRDWRLSFADSVCSPQVPQLHHTARRVHSPSTHTHTHTHTYTHTHEHTYSHTHTLTLMHTRTCARTNAHTHTPHNRQHNHAYSSFPQIVIVF